MMVWSNLLFHAIVQSEVVEIWFLHLIFWRQFQVRNVAVIPLPPLCWNRGSNLVSTYSIAKRTPPQKSTSTLFTWEILNDKDHVHESDRPNFGCCICKLKISIHVMWDRQQYLSISVWDQQKQSGGSMFCLTDDFICLFAKMQNSNCWNPRSLAFSRSEGLDPVS